MLDAPPSVELPGVALSDTPSSFVSGFIEELHHFDVNIIIYTKVNTIFIDYKKKRFLFNKNGSYSNKDP